MNVPDYDSPSESYCKNCIINEGCGIYSERKEICKSFGCLWWHEKSMPLYLRPDICGVLIEIYEHNIFLAYLDPNKPDVLNNKEIKILFNKCVEAGHPVVVYTGRNNPNIFHLPNNVNLSNVVNWIKMGKCK